MFTLKLDDQNYTLVTTRSQADQKILFWVWGKINFKSYYHQKSGDWELDKVTIVRGTHEYAFKATTGHGAMLEETEWVGADQSIYIELPPHFGVRMQEISASFIKQS